VVYINNAAGNGLGYISFDIFSAARLPSRFFYRADVSGLPLYFSPNILEQEKVPSRLAQ